MITEDKITCAVAKALREEKKLSQTAFWGPIGVCQPTGCRYEQDVRIPRPVRILLVAKYVCGLALDTTSKEGVAELKNLGSAQHAARKAKSSIDKAAKHLSEAGGALQSA